MHIGKVLVKYQKAKEPERHLSQGSMHWDRSGTLYELRQRFVSKINAGSEIEQYLDNLQKLKSRYFCDTLSTLLKKTGQYSASTINQAIEICYQKDIYRFLLLLDTIEMVRLCKGEDLLNPQIPF